MKNSNHCFDHISPSQERLKQQAIKEAEKERAEYYAKQKESQKAERAKYREKVSKETIYIFPQHFCFQYKIDPSPEPSDEEEESSDEEDDGFGSKKKVEEDDPAASKLKKSHNILSLHKS